MSNFPRRDDWVLQPLYQYQGFWYFQDYLVGLLAAQENFKPQPSDIVLCTYPKTGTTWLKALAYAIVTRSKFNDSENPLLTKAPHDCVPFLEIDAARNASNRDPEIPLVATHIPYNSLPTSILESGISSNGPYWDHVLGYWKARVESPEEVLFLVYEDLKKDTVSNVKKLAEFMGYPFTPEEEKRGVVQQIIDLCSFDSLRNMKASKSGVYSPDSHIPFETLNFSEKVPLEIGRIISVKKWVLVWIR
ncbi:hypothetical protein GH714_041021 [Hevea brasiliensis]|uniref:Sulfotransferase n=1 Tax=Hevea brasiliensis TaxID=3981 RepID=A0A6A6NA41_HEVBR|nr:hypothetical protein GH714_041021 [Hevea brasiliensis]